VDVSVLVVQSSCRDVDKCRRSYVIGYEKGKDDKYRKEIK
jgi:hypothetical protein